MASGAAMSFRGPMVLALAIVLASAGDLGFAIAPKLTLVDCQMIGASGRLFMSGEKSELERARDHIVATLKAVKGRG